MRGGADLDLEYLKYLEQRPYMEQNLVHDYMKLASDLDLVGLAMESLLLVGIYTCWQQAGTQFELGNHHLAGYQLKSHRNLTAACTVSPPDVLQVCYRRIYYNDSRRQPWQPL